MDSFDKSMAIVFVALFALVAFVIHLIDTADERRNYIKAGYEQVVEDGKVVWKKTKEDGTNEK